MGKLWKENLGEAGERVQKLIIVEVIEAKRLGRKYKAEKDNMIISLGMPDLGIVRDSDKIVLYLSEFRKTKMLSSICMFSNLSLSTSVLTYSTSQSPGSPN